MAEGVGHEGYFWNTHPWINISDQEKPAADKLVDSTQKQPESFLAASDKVAAAAAATTTNTSGGGGEKGKGENEGGGEHEIHIWTERERRKKMRNMFTQLHTLLPQLPPKADKSTIVDEAVGYIKTLQQTLQKLQKQKLERLYGITKPQKAATSDTRESFLADQGSSTSFSFPQCFPATFQTWTSSNVTLNVCGRDAHISICSSKKPGLFSAICFLFDKHKLDIVSAQISSDNSKSMYMIHAHANAPEQFAETLPYDEIYKQAVAEIMLWVNSS